MKTIESNIYHLYVNAFYKYKDFAFSKFIVVYEHCIE
jgi:hypothetical protein